MPPAENRTGSTRFDPSWLLLIAAALFLVQVLAGVLTVHDFVGFTTFFGIDLAAWLAITVTRSWSPSASS